MSLKNNEKLQFDWTVNNYPKVGIIITHYNYSEYVERAIDAVLAQTYSNFECVIIDDCSDFKHQTALDEIVSKKQGKVKKYTNPENKGQLLSFYAGVEKVDAEFYCLLDPDDEYLPTFIEEMVFVHLNPQIYVPMVCCNQVAYRNGQQISGTLLKTKNNTSVVKSSFSNRFSYQIHHSVGPDSYWPWTSSSSMIFRKDVLKVLYSEKLSVFKMQADSYLAEGCHMLGGTLIYDKALVKRGFHENNSSRKNHLIAITESRVKSTQPGRVERQKEHALINILNNNGLEYFGKKHFREILTSQFDLSALLRIRKNSPAAGKILTFSQFFKIAITKIMKFSRK